MYDILNKISAVDYAPDFIKKFKLGDCIRSILSVFDACDGLGMDIDDHTLKQKHIILNSLICIDMNKIKDDEYDKDEVVLNKGFLYALNKTYKNIKDQVIENRIRFNKGETATLFDEDKLGNRTRNDGVPLELLQNMDHFWEHTTSPTPNTHLSRLNTNPETGTKEQHIYHFCDVPFKDKYIEWKEQALDIIARLNTKTPCNEIVQSRRREFHKYIYQTPESDYSHCADHFNFKQQHNVLVSVYGHQYIHQCDPKKQNYTFTSKKTNYRPKCECNKCIDCLKLYKIFNQKSTAFMKKICCPNGNKLPKLACIECRCTVNNCGYNWIIRAIKGHGDRHKFDKCVIKYDQIQVIEKSEDGRPIYGIKQHTKTYSEFIEIYIASFKKYARHHYIHIWMHQQKLVLLSGLRKTDLFTRWDYINDPKVKYYHKTNNQWGKPNKFALLIGVDDWHHKYDDRTKAVITDTKTTSYFCQDSEHDFSSALVIIEKHIQSSKASHISKTGAVLNTIYNRSDQGEFLCTAFLDGLSVLSEKHDLNMFWEMGPANHNKDICDAEGHTDKSAMDRGVVAGKLLYTADKPHVVTAAEYCTEYFSGMKRKREFIPALDKITHIKSGNYMKERLDGISGIYCFGFFRKAHYVWTKTVSCHCEYCMKGQWNNCINIDNTGQRSKPHKLKLNIYYDSTTNTDTNPNKRRR